MTITAQVGQGRIAWASAEYMDSGLVSLCKPVRRRISSFVFGILFLLKLDLVTSAVWICI